MQDYLVKDSQKREDVSSETSIIIETVDKSYLEVSDIFKITLEQWFMTETGIIKAGYSSEYDVLIHFMFTSHLAYFLILIHFSFKSENSFHNNQYMLKKQKV